MSFKVKDEGKEELRKIIKELEKFERASIEVGIIGDSGEYKSGGGKRITTLEIARIHEFGYGDLPERSFIRAGFDKYKGDLINQLEKMASKILSGDITAEDATDYVGKWLRDSIVEYITELDSPPLKLQTIKQKGSSSPLIDTGQLRDSITYKVVM